MTSDNQFANEERVVTVREIADGEETVFYAIRDVYLDYWRSEHPLSDYAAWTRDRRQRAEYRNRCDAVEELHRIWRLRGGSDGDEPNAEDREVAAA